MEINTLPSSFLLLSLVYPNQNPKGEREPTNEIYLGQPPVSYQRVQKMEWGPEGTNKTYSASLNDHKDSMIGSKQSHDYVRK